MNPVTVARNVRQHFALRRNVTRFVQDHNLLSSESQLAFYSGCLLHMKITRAPLKVPQQTRSLATVDAILEAATRLFSDNGFEAVSTNAVALRAGVSVGSLYQYFPNKHSLLEAVKVRHIKDLWAVLDAACAEGCGMPLEIGLRHFVAAGIAYNVQHSALMRVIYAVLPTQVQTDDRLLVAKSVHDQQLRLFLQAHKASLKVEVEPAVAMIPVLGRGIFMATMLDRPEDLKSGAVIDKITLVILNYLT